MGLCKSLWRAFAALFLLTFLTAAGFAAKSLFWEECSGEVCYFFIDGVKHYYMNCVGSCIVEECRIDWEWEPRSHDVCKCGDQVPSGLCRSEFWWVDEGGFANFGNLKCIRTGCWTTCSKVDEASVPESPYFVPLCSCPPPPPIEE